MIMNIVTYLMSLVSIGGIVAYEWFMTGREDASLLFVLLFWTAVGQGIFALCTAVELGLGKWFLPIREKMLRFYPILFVFPACFLLMFRHVSVYPWHDTQPNRWLAPDFFMMRNIVALLLPFLFATIYSWVVVRKSKQTAFWAIMYIFSFVTCQSLLAFDWVMSFEHPWVSTLFGPYFFIESMYSGIALTALVGVLLYRRYGQKFESALRDTVTLLLGFAVFWGGLFFAQFLTIWYGNIPEEVIVIEKRLNDPILGKIIVAVLLCLLAIPFLTMLSRQNKIRLPPVILVSFAVFSGIILERFFFLRPVMTMLPNTIAIEWLILSLPFLTVIFGILREEGKANHA
jgi:hypothetical protein